MPIYTDVVKCFEKICNISAFIFFFLPLFLCTHCICFFETIMYHFFQLLPFLLCWTQLFPFLFSHKFFELTDFPITKKINIFPRVCTDLRITGEIVKMFKKDYKTQVNIPSPLTYCKCFCRTEKTSSQQNCSEITHMSFKKMK